MSDERKSEVGDVPRQPEAEFGAALRRAREAAGLSVSELVQRTRIQARYVEALEAEDWDTVPGAVIGRGFVRVLAKELRAPADDLMRRYREARGDRDGEPVHALPESDWKVDLRSGRRAPPLFILLVIALLGAAGLWVWSPWTERTPVVPLARESVAPEPAAGPEQVVVAPAAAAPAPAATTPAEESPAAVEPPREVRLGVQAVERVWVRVVVDGAAPVDRNLKPGERQEFEADTSIQLKLGNAGGVRLFWNDVALRVPGKPGAVVTLSFPEDLETLRP